MHTGCIRKDKSVSGNKDMESIMLARHDESLEKEAFYIKCFFL